MAAPLFTIVMPSLNQAPFVESAVRSVLEQRPEAFEFLLLDGGSTDGTPAVVEKFARELDYYRSGPDGGQALAVAEGWSRGAGRYLGYLNSDDLLMPGALATVRRAFDERPEAVAVVGSERLIDEHGCPFAVRRVRDARASLIEGWSLPQPAMFIRREALERAGGVAGPFRLIFDLDLWMRLAPLGPIVVVPEILAATRHHPQTLTVRRRVEIVGELVTLGERGLRGDALHGFTRSERRRFWESVCSLAVAQRWPRTTWRMVLAHSWARLRRRVARRPAPTLVESAARCARA